MNTYKFYIETDTIKSDNIITEKAYSYKIAVTRVLLDLIKAKAKTISISLIYTDDYHAKEYVNESNDTF